MRPRFTTFQKIMTAIFIALQIAVMICDIVRLATADENATGTYYYAVNLVLCIGLLAVFMVLIFNPRICVSSDETDSEEQLTVLISASRTYMCFIAVDIALIFAFVMFLSKRVSHPALLIVIGGVAMFVAGAVKYIYDSQKLVAAIDNDGEGAEQATEEAAPEQENASGEETAAEREVEETASEQEVTDDKIVEAETAEEQPDSEAAAEESASENEEQVTAQEAEEAAEEVSEEAEEDAEAEDEKLPAE